MGKRAAVILMNMGGPDSLEAVSLFMHNLFMDESVFQFPLRRITQPIFATVLTRLRAEKVRRQYAQIGGRSPIGPLTHAQAIALRAALRRHGCHAAVAVAMRYTHPGTEEALMQLAAEAPAAPLIALPLYPHYCRATTGSSLAELKRRISKFDQSGKLQIIESYPTHPQYIAALVQRIAEKLRHSPPDTQILFSAHGVPQSYVREGDPYVSQIKATCKAVQLFFPARTFHLAYQSKVGPVKWVGPSMEEMLHDLGGRGVKSLLVVPVSFVSDHIETLYEIDILYAGMAASAGIAQFERVRSLNGSPLFIDCLASLVLEKLGQS